MANKIIAYMFISGVALCCTTILLGQSFLGIKVTDDECIVSTDFYDCTSDVVNGLCNLEDSQNISCPDCPPGIIVSASSIYYGSFNYSEENQTLHFLSLNFVNNYNTVTNSGVQFFSHAINDSRYYNQDFFQGILPIDGQLYLNGKFRYGILDPEEDTLTFKYFRAADRGQNALVKYKDKIIGLKVTEIDSLSGQHISSYFKPILYEYDLVDFMDGPTKLIELDYEIPGMTHPFDSQNMATAQINCEDVRLYFNSRGDLIYFYPETPTVYPVCDYSHFSLAAINFPKWSDCRLSIDLDLDDEPIQFNRDFIYDADCYTDLPIVDDDIQVFASVGSIDSITVVINNPLSTQYLTGSSSAAISIVDNNTASLTLTNNGSASFDDYEVLMKSILFIDDGPGADALVEIHFQAYHDTLVGNISTTYLSTIKAFDFLVQDTSIYVCYDDPVVDLTDMIIPFTGTWIDSDSVFNPQIDTSNTVLQYMHENACKSDTSFFEFVIRDRPFLENSENIICSDSIIINGLYYSQDTVIQDTLMALDGCDSLYTSLTLKFLKSVEFVIQDTTMCFGDSLLDNNIWYKEEVELLDTLRNLNNCDSIISSISLAFSPAPILEQSLQELCHGDTIFLNGEAITKSGTFLVISSYVQSGCDSLVSEIQIEFSEPTLFENRSQSICFSDSILIGDDWVFESGIFLDTIKNVNNCDSIIDRLDLRFSDTPVFFEVDTLVCFGESLTLHGEEILVDGLYLDTLYSALGCDSLINEYDLRFEELSFEPFEVFNFEGKIGETIILDLAIEDISSIIWTPGSHLSCSDCLTPVADIVEENQYYDVILSTNSFCNYNITVLVSGIDELQTSENMLDQVYIPNVLAKNAEGNNSIFYLQADLESKIGNYDLHIYDRWGNEVFSRLSIPPNQPELGWNTKQTKLEMGVYIFRIKYGNEIKAGTVTLF